MKIKEDKINQLKKFGFKEQTYPVGHYQLSQRLTYEANLQVFSSKSPYLRCIQMK